MEPATNQPELQPYYVSEKEIFTGISRVFKPVCLLDHEYSLDEFPDYYFVIRKNKYCNDPEDERVNLYRKGVVNEHLRGDLKPFTSWISNELRNGRSIETIYCDMREKAINIAFNENLSRKKQKR